MMSLFFVNGDATEFRAAVETQAAGDAAGLLKLRGAIAHLVEFGTQHDTILGATFDAHAATLATRRINSDIIFVFVTHTMDG